jgi:hypothetical protein
MAACNESYAHGPPLSLSIRTAACFPLVVVAIFGGVAAPGKPDRRLSHVLSHSDVLCMHTMLHAQTTTHTGQMHADSRLIYLLVKYLIS